VVWANQFAKYQKSAGYPEGVAQGLTAAHPANHALASWKRDYPVGAGDCYSLYPKSWTTTAGTSFAHVTLEQFSPVLPDNYRESSYPVAVYRWHADNPTDHAVTVSVLLAWTNMLGWFRDYSQNIKDSLDAGNVNHWVDTQEGAAGNMVGIVLNRAHLRPVEDEGDGQMAGRDPRVARSGGELSDHVPHRLGRRECDQNRQWRNLEIVFERWPAGQSELSWVSGGQHLGGALAVRFTLKPGEKRVVPMV
jgi:non-lysosomal glucosylceramidase